jgi:hypothetical protein
MRCRPPAGSRCTAIPDATAATYQLARADIGRLIAVDVSGSNVYGTGTAVQTSFVGPVLPGLRANRRVHARVLRAAVKLVRHAGAHVTLSATLSGRIAASLAVKPGTTLHGSGVVDFRTGAGRWNLSLPEVLGGGSLVMATRHDRTYMRLGAVTSTVGRRWIVATPRQLRRVGRLGIVAALGMLADPYETVGLVRSTTDRVATGRALGASADRAPAAASVAAAADDGESCTATPGIDSAQSALNTDNLKALGKDYKDSYHEILSTLSDSWELATSDYGYGGLASTQLISNEGLTLQSRFCTASEPPGFSTPPPSALLSITDWLTIDPCLVGNWLLSGPLPNPGGAPIAAGYVTLQISPVGISMITYDEHSIYVEEGEFGLPDALGGPDAVGVFGSASLGVIAPLAATAVGHKLIWSIYADAVHQIFPGFIVDDPESDYYNVTDPLEVIVGPSGVVQSSYSCDAGAQTLTVKEPIGNDQSLTFVRTSKPYHAPGS